MHKRGRISAVYAIAVALVLCLFLVFSFWSASDVADALLPVGYVENVINEDSEWWTADDYFGLSQLKATVNSWLGSSVYNFDYLRENPIIIAIIDSGASIEHELFSGRYGADGRYDIGAVDKNGVGIYDVLLRDGSGNPILKNTAVSHGYKENDISDDEKQRHGTHVAGIAAMLIHALGLEQYIKLLPIKASYHYKPLLEEWKDSFDGDDVKDAVKFAIGQGADVVNMSLSSESADFAKLNSSDAYKNAVLVAAAGNDGKSVKRYPAALPNVIGVMNYTHPKSGGIALSGTSNYGDGYDLCAPGTDIFSADGDIAPDGGFEYKSLSGTSMASPVVAFGAAVLAMKYKALAGGQGEEISSVELAELVKNAYGTVVTKNESGKEIGSYKVFDVNKLVGSATHEARIDVDDLSLLTQRLGSIGAIGLSVSVVPTSEYGKGSVEWFADGKKIGSGFEISYTPEAKVGEMTVKAVWKHESAEHGAVEQTATLMVSVDYMPVTADSVSGFELVVRGEENEIVSPSALETGRTYRFDVDGFQNIPAATAKSCLWFVNGVYMHTGADFEFTSSAEKSYEIRIKLNGYEGRRTVVTVSGLKTPDRERGKELRLFTIVFCAVAGGSAIILAAAVIIRQKRNKV